MENLNENENEYKKNYNCLMKLYHFQESMRKFQIEQNESTNFYLINPKSLINYNEYCNIKDLKSIFSNNAKSNGAVKSKIKIEKLPIIKEKDNDEYPYKEIKIIFKVKYRTKELDLSCYNKIIIVNEEIKNLMNNITNFIKENIIFINDYIAIPLKMNILEIFKYDNIKRICRPRYIMIFEDQLYTDRAIKELSEEGLFNYLYKKNMKGHIKHEVIYDNKRKKLGEIINISDMLKEIQKKEKLQKIESLMKKETDKKLIEEKEDKYEDEKFNYDDLKEDNKNNNNKNKNINNNSLLKEDIIKENENSKEKSIANDYEEEFKDLKNFEKGEFEEKSEKGENNNNIQNSKNDNIINREIQSENYEPEKEFLNELEGEQKDNNINENEIKNEINNANNNIEQESMDKIKSEQIKKLEEDKNTEKNIQEEINVNNGMEEKKEESENKMNIEGDKNEQKEEEYNDEFNQIKEGTSFDENKKINNEKEEKEKEPENNLKAEKENNLNEKEELTEESLLSLRQKLKYSEKSENEENKIGEEKSIKENENQIIKEEEKINEQTKLKDEENKNDEEKMKKHESIILEDEDIDDAMKIKEEKVSKEEEKKEEQSMKLGQEKNIMDNIQQKPEENEIKNKEEEIQNNLNNEEIQRKKIEEEIKNKLEDEEIQNNKKQEDINNQLNEEELLRKKIEEQKNQELLEEENLKKQIEEKNQEDLEDELELKKIEEDLGLNNTEEKNEKKSLDEKTKEEIAYKNTHFIQSLQEDPKIGLNNIGATCYMNATIQCLSRTTELSNYFLNQENKISQDEKLSFSYLNLISNLWHKQEDNASSYSPYDFKNIVSEMNPLFQGIAANDSKDLILFILQQLHEELKLKIEGDTLLNQNKEIADQTNRNAVLEEFKESMKNNVSIISELFFGMNEIISDCLNCRQKGNPIIKYNFQIFNFIIFPLKEVSNYKKTKSNNNNMNTNEDSVTIYDCFEQFVQPALMTGDNMMFCNKCQQLANSSYTTKIYYTPKILILILNRGKGNEFKIKINFDKIISIGQYVEQKEEEELKYELYGVLTHLGTSDMSGHFVSFCYSIIDKIWYKFNDAFVEPVNDFQKEIHDFEDPYILFYRKMN